MWQPVLAKWFRLGSWRRFAIVTLALVAVGFGMDAASHALGWPDPPVPTYVEVPVFFALITFLTRDRRGRNDDDS